MSKIIPLPEQQPTQQEKFVTSSLSTKQQQLEAVDSIFTKLGNLLGIDPDAHPKEQERLVNQFHRVIDTQDHQFLIDNEYTQHQIKTGILTAVRIVSLKKLAGSSSDLKKAKKDRLAAEKEFATEEPKITKKIAELQADIEVLRTRIQPRIHKHHAMLDARKQLLSKAPEAVRRQHEIARREQLVPMAEKIREAKNKKLEVENLLKITDQQLRSLSENHEVFNVIRNPLKPTPSLPTLSEFQVEHRPILEELKLELKKLVDERDVESDAIDSLFQDF